MLKQGLDYLLNLTDEQLACLKQSILDMLQHRQRQQNKLLSCATPGLVTVASVGAAAGAAPAEASHARGELTSDPVPSPPSSSHQLSPANAAASAAAVAAEGQKTEEPWGPERLINRCPEADLSLIPKQLEALQRLQSPVDRQTEVRDRQTNSTSSTFVSILSTCISCS